MTRRRLEATASKDLILDAVERLMEREGYGGVNTRSVALEAGVKPTLVHYHFATTENLLLEAYRRAAARTETSLAKTLKSENVLRALWQYHSDPKRTALAAQFMALAAHRPNLCAEIGHNVEKFRRMQEVALSATPIGEKLSKLGYPPSSITLLIAAVGRAFVSESAIGVTNGHAELRSIIETLLTRTDVQTL
jgi:AcrR family transcriptional regulator